MFDRYDADEQVILVHIFFSQDKDMEDLQKFESLVSSAVVAALHVVTGSRKAPHPKYFVGDGKEEEIAETVKTSSASVVLFDHALPPAQELNFERLCEYLVIDRTRLILDIFAQRARTNEGKLQVELAQLRHLAMRLVRCWTHTLSDKRAASGCAGRGKPSFRPTAVCCGTVSARSVPIWNRWRNSTSRAGSPALGRMYPLSRSWAIPTPVSPLCLI